MTNDLHSVEDAAQRLKIPPTQLRGWLARIDIKFVRRLPQRRNSIGFEAPDLFALAIFRDLVAHGVAVRDASVFAERVLARAGTPPDDLVAVVQGGVSPALEIVDAASMPRIDEGARLVLPLRALWREIIAGQ